LTAYTVVFLLLISRMLTLLRLLNPVPDENGKELSLPYGTAINRNVSAAKIDAEIGEYYSDHDEGEYVLQRRIVQH
jgi:Flp pilus assembly protein protease CpaA